MKVAKKAAQKIKTKASCRVKTARVKAAQVRRSLDEVLIENDHLKKVYRQILQKKHLVGKESELATQLALQVLERAKKIRQKLERRARRSWTSQQKVSLQAEESTTTVLDSSGE